MLEISWSYPAIPNGIITYYRLYRSTNGLPFAVWFTGDGNIYNVTDSTVQPLGQYRYILEAATVGGRTNSTAVVVILPSVTPSYIPAPNNVTALSATALFVAWDSISNSTDGQYYVLLNAGTNSESVWPAFGTTLVINGLRPFTLYQARMRGCIQGITNGCGTGPPAAGVWTFESSPSGQLPPYLSAIGPISIAISWQPPEIPSGVILRYLLDRRTVGVLSNDDGLLINTFNGSSLSFVDSGADLLPFTTYEYRVTALNSQGQVQSNWSRVQTLEATPSGLKSPSISAVGAYSFLTWWSTPAMSNGIILSYKVEYSAATTDQLATSSITVPGSVLNTSISSLQPNTNYIVRVNASNSVGTVSSPWTKFSTLTATPAGIGLITVQVQTGGLSAMLSWSVPTHPNGAITNYAIYLNGNINAVYQGTSLKYLLVGLLPFSSYSIRLEACTTAGCTRSSWQQFMTSSIAPGNQPAPSVLFINATEVSLRWGPPGNSYGPLLSYAVYRTSVSSGATDQTMIFWTTDTGRTGYNFTDLTVQPYTR